ncbi:arsenate reductase (azurin) small subunit [Cupriavidus basilensis]|uniref:Arsenate reductase (Azurin) small subunit n=1 Tax=Cupriavidus basilensis TaxID=68895 RepID=A0ABT6ATZ7_9BURK|nr:arsenate reductase (azurin) small subunit [Cupriavidus basilensis]MDF3835858.1 arsenate reductase (azurin) small subunit [Cupriavidus basilensis]
MSITRRQFLKATGGVAAGIGVSGSLSTPAQAAPAPADPGRTTLPFSPKVVAHLGQLRVNTPVSFLYPDASSPCAVIKMGMPVPGGVGPDRDVVAYSTLCTHMGCPVAYDAGARTFKCPCHFSIFDPEKSGQMVLGQATENLPMVQLQYNASDGTVKAVGIEGLIYGRQANLL